MQLGNYDQYSTISQNFELNVLNDIIKFQNDKQKQQFQILFESPENYSNKNANKFTKRSTTCSNKNGNLGEGSYFQRIFISRSGIGITRLMF